MVLLRAKKKQTLEINKLESVRTENDDNELKLKQDKRTEKEDSSSADQPSYAEILTVTPQNVLSTSEELVEYLNLKSTLTDGYSKIKLEPADSKHTLPAKPLRQVSLSGPMSEETECGSVYQDIEQHSSTTILEQGTHIYTMSDTKSSSSVEAPSRIHEAVYSEPIQPSLFTGAVEDQGDREYLHPYAPIYTIPIDQSKSEEAPLKVLSSNIREIRELGMGQFWQSYSSRDTWSEC